MKGMFAGAESFNQPIGNWDVSLVSDMRGMFMYAKSFNHPIGNWKVSNATDILDMFFQAALFNQPVYYWDVSGRKTEDIEVTYYKVLFDEFFDEPIEI